MNLRAQMNRIGGNEGKNIQPRKRHSGSVPLRLLLRASLLPFAASLVVSFDPAIAQEMGGFSPAGLIVCDRAAQMLVTERLAEARSDAEQCIASLHQSYPPDDPVFLPPLHIVAAVLFQEGETAEAREVFRRMGKVRIEKPGDSAMVHEVAATLLDGEGNAAAAEAGYRQALRDWETAGRGDSADAGAILNALGSLYIKQKRFADAGIALDRALMILTEAKDAVPMDVLNVLMVRGILHARRREWHDAEQDLRDALAIADRNPPLDSDTLRVLLLNYARVLYRNHERQAARKMEARAALLGRNPLDNVVDVADLVAERRSGVK